MIRSGFLVLCVAVSVAGCAQLRGERNDMGFFLAANTGNGADLDGLSGADQRCQSLAKQAGAGDRAWRAYLSTSTGVNARDRIGSGPWRNVKGVVVAKNVQDLHGNPNINAQTALTEKGAAVNSRREKPNYHDILTGSQPDGTAFPAAKGDTTCRDWTSSAEGSAFVGHHDREGLRDDAPSRSWNSSHPTKGCSQEALRSTGGNGYFYCFAAD
jgi:hypothetical protein